MNYNNYYIYRVVFEKNSDKDDFQLLSFLIGWFDTSNLISSCFVLDLNSTIYCTSVCEGDN